jgi:hypothetical protein
VLSQPPGAILTLSPHINLGIFRHGPALRRIMSQFPATVKAITFSKTGDIDVIEKTDQPFPQQNPGDVILKVCVTTIRPAVRGN